MRPSLRVSLIYIAGAVAMSSCKPAAETPPAAPVAAPVPVTAAAPAWPTGLTVIGDGFPNPGDPCRQIGESAATSNYLDDSASLVGCLSLADAETLGGKVVATVDGVTLVSVPSPSAMSGDGDGQADAKVAGTKYNATAQVRCAGYQGAPGGMCDAGVVRGTETGTYVEIALPDGRQRTILFDNDGKFLSFSIAQSNGTAAMKSGASHEGDTTIATLGTERYEIPDVFLKGD